LPIAFQSDTHFVFFFLFQVIYLLFFLSTRGSGKALARERNCKNCLTFFVASCGLYRCSVPVDFPELAPTNCYTQSIIVCPTGPGVGKINRHESALKVLLARSEMLLFCLLLTFWHRCFTFKF
jgi:hypothetical protein